MSLPLPLHLPLRCALWASPVGLRLLAGLLALLLAAAAQADRDDRDDRDDQGDHERARAAVQAGEVMPLAQLLALLQRSHPGQVLGLALEREHGRWVYELKLLQNDGQLLKLALDARSGDVLERQRRGKVAPGRPLPPAAAPTTKEPRPR